MRYLSKCHVNTLGNWSSSIFWTFDETQVVDEAYEKKCRHMAVSPNTFLHMHKHIHRKVAVLTTCLGNQGGFTFCNWG